MIGSFGAVYDRGLAGLLGDEPDMQILQVLELADIAVAVDQYSPRIAILGPHHLGGPSTLRRLRTVQPGIGLVVLVGQHMSERYRLQLLGLGATACLPVCASRSDLLMAIRLAADGKRFLISASRVGTVSDFTAMMLTKRELEVLQLLQDGRSNPEIATALHITVDTASTHVKRIYRKLGVTRRSELVMSTRIA